jgi:hypothetical protein
MKPRAIIKIAVDILMTAGIFALMGRHLWGDAFHEWLGMCVGVLFIVHNILNRKWYTTLFKGRYTPHRVMGICVNVLLMVAMIALMFSGILMSQILSGLRLPGMTGVARKLHIIGSYWGFLTISLHIGIHGDMFIGMAKKRIRSPKFSKIRRTILLGVALLIAGYGASVFTSRNFITYMFLQSEFVFLDFSEPKLMFYLDYLSLMGLGVFVGHYTSRGLKTFRKSKEKMEEDS